MEQYVANIQVMEQLTRVRTNLALLRKHQAQTVAAGKPTIEVEVVGLRIGDFVLVTFPGELTVQTGLDIKRRSPHELTFVAGYTNGYIYYTPPPSSSATPATPRRTATPVAPGWQAIFEPGLWRSSGNCDSGSPARDWDEGSKPRGPGP